MMAGQWVMTSNGLRGRFVHVVAVITRGQKAKRMAIFEIEERGLWGCPPEDIMLEEDYYRANPTSRLSGMSPEAATANNGGP